MERALSMPMVKVDRNSYLRREFSKYGNSDSLRTKRPIDLYSLKDIDKVAQSAIKSHLLKVTATSAAAGIPGGLAMVGTVPADLAQYYWHVLVLAQKLGYIYGWGDLLDEENQIDEETRNILTVFVGVMLGAEAANAAIRSIAKSAAVQVGKRVSQQALTKTMWYPIAKNIGKWIGVNLTKKVAAQTASKVVPIFGAIISGGITYGSFRPMASKLQNVLRKEMELHNKTAMNY
ncbi:hypothetical protein ACYSNX_07195 [Myroides sp. LJL115]